MRDISDSDLFEASDKQALETDHNDMIYLAQQLEKAARAGDAEAFLRLAELTVDRLISHMRDEHSAIELISEASAQKYSTFNQKIEVQGLTILSLLEHKQDRQTLLGCAEELKRIIEREILISNKRKKPMPFGSFLNKRIIEREILISNKRKKPMPFGSSLEPDPC